MNWRLPAGITIGFITAATLTIIAWYVIPPEATFTVRHQCTELQGRAP